MKALSFGPVVCSRGGEGWAVWMETLLSWALIETWHLSYFLKVGVKAIRWEIKNKYCMEFSFLI